MVANTDRHKHTLPACRLDIKSGNPPLLPGNHHTSSQITAAAALHAAMGLCVKALPKSPHAPCSQGMRRRRSLDHVAFPLAPSVILAVPLGPARAACTTSQMLTRPNIPNAPKILGQNTRLVRIGLYALWQAE